MNKTEIHAKVKELLSSGTTKSEAFAQLSGQGVKDSQLAYSIAGYPDPTRCNEHSGKVKILITVMIVQAVILLPLGFFIGSKIGPNAKWIIGILCALIPLLFAFGFYANRVGVYNAYILLSIVQLPNAFKGFSSTPIASSIGLVISIGLITYVWYVREKIFPGFTLVTPKKVKGKYIFEG
jgi:hypothetical protein